LDIEPHLAILLESPLFENIRLSANGVCIKLITSSGTFLNGIRQIIAVNLPLGLLRHRRQWALLGLTLSRTDLLMCVPSVSRAPSYYVCERS
jgi:hypothetical protein